MSGTNVDYSGKFYPEKQDVASELPHYALRKPFQSDELVGLIKQGMRDYLARSTISTTNTRYQNSETGLQ